MSTIEQDVQKAFNEFWARQMTPIFTTLTQIMQENLQLKAENERLKKMNKTRRATTLPPIPGVTNVDVTTMEGM
jgi:regulator of replication initiation timing